MKKKINFNNIKKEILNIKILLIGDFMIDNYIIGESSRMSPEAPVPVVIPKKEYSIPGGAGNVAMNLCSMGVNVTCMGFIGNDIWGKKLNTILKNEGAHTEYIDVIDNHPTTLKQRIYSNGKQVARLDSEKIIDWKPDSYNNRIYNNYDIIILSDYNKGALNQSWFNIGDFNNVIVDPKKENFEYYRKANIITPNLNEIKRASKIEINDESSLINACDELINKCDFQYMVVKKGDKGMTIIGKDNFKKDIKAHRVDQPDVTGAGDTVIAILSIIYAITNDIELSAFIANSAASIVVDKPGTAVVNIDELEKKINNII